MEPRIFHGEITPDDLAHVLIGEYNRGNLRAQKLANQDHVVVQIATRDRPTSGGATALSVSLRKVEDGVAVQMGQLSWYSVAASLGKTALMAWLNPLNLLNRLDDIAQDVESLQLSEQVWATIEKAARAAGASFELSDRLRRLACDYCGTANPPGEPSCIACGAPLGAAQPRTCKRCGFVVTGAESVCPNCKARL